MHGILLVLSYKCSILSTWFYHNLLPTVLRTLGLYREYYNIDNLSQHDRPILPNAGSILDHGCRRWPNIQLTLVSVYVFVVMFAAVG